MVHGIRDVCDSEEWCAFSGRKVFEPHYQQLIVYSPTVYLTTVAPCAAKTRRVCVVKKRCPAAVRATVFAPKQVRCRNNCRCER